MDFAMLFLIIGAIGGTISILFAYYLWSQIKKLSVGEDRVNEVYNAIRTGAKAYLKREFRTILIIAAILAVIIGLALNIWVAISYVIGSLFSLAASFIGMDLATRTNVRATLAAKQGLIPSMRTAFKGGTIMGMLVFGINILQIVGLFALFYYVVGMPLTGEGNLMVNIVGLAFGSSFTSVIAQLGGGIYTKGADVGADIVGKVEAGIPEDDPRNPAVIADFVGDNVGDCAGRSADLYETLTSEILSSIILGIAIFTLIPAFGSLEPSNPMIIVIFFPFVIRCISAGATIIGYFYVVKTTKGEDAWKILNRGLYLSSIIIAIAYVILVFFIFSSIPLMFAAIIGVMANLVMGKIVESYTGFKSKAVKEISDASETGPATNVITGMANGLRSIFVPLLSIVAFVLASYGCGMLYGVQAAIDEEFILTAGIYGIVLMAIGMTSGTGIILSMDGFGPIADNAGGIAEMAELDPEIRTTIDKLDATGNSTKSLTKGFSIISGTTIGFVTIFAFLELLRELTGSEPIINLGDPRVAVGGILGVITVFLFVSLLMKAVGKTAGVMIDEVRDQFKTRKILEGIDKPDYARCVDISTVSALKGMLYPSLLIIAMPIIVGLILGPITLVAYLIVGTFVAGGFGIFMNIAGASWDNAKKFRKTLRDKAKPETIEAYKAAVIGDTVGDPCKDTAGSSLGSFVTTINNMGLTFFPLFVNFSLFFLIFGIY
jgi:K(+)-stimulated pyrophosphate-energized sodium pump